MGGAPREMKWCFNLINMILRFCCQNSGSGIFKITGFAFGQLQSNFQEATKAEKYLKCAWYPNLALFSPIALMNVFPMFNSICLCLSKADPETTFNSYLFRYLFRIFAVFLVVFCTFSNVIYISCLYFLLLNPFHLFIFCHVIAFVFLE
jgi:hypothetical protein